MSTNPNSTDSTNSVALAWVAIVMAGCIGAWFGRRMSLYLEPILRAAVPVLFAVAGLSVLVPLALRPPRADVIDRDRVRKCARASAQVMIGVAVAIPIFELSIALLAACFVLVIAASCGIPKKFFGRDGESASDMH